jgi:predicted lipid-binding transport protein (Tim44 family)
LARESRIEPSIAAAPVPAPSAHFARPLPEGFDAPAFVEQAKLQFHRLQAAYDKADQRMLSDVMTPEMTTQILADIAQRGDHRPTEVVSLNAEVLEVRTADRAYWASVRFTGTLREDDSVLPTPIDEVWNLTKPVDGSSGWLLAGIEQVQTA